MTRRVEAKVIIEAPAAVVWKALTEADELIRWFPLQAKAEPGPGGSIWMSWGGMYEGASTIQVWDPEKHLRLEFPMDGPGPLATDYYLEAKGGTTVLRVVSSGFGEGDKWDDFYDGVDHGWAFELASLKHYLERHRGEDRVVAWPRARYADRASAWERLLALLGGMRVSPGERYAVTTTTGDALEGVGLVWRPPRLLTATVANWNDALLRVELEGGAEGNVWLWLSTYGVDEAKVRGLERRWQAALDEAFGVVG